MSKESKKLGKVITRKVATSTKKEDSQSTMKSMTHFSLWVFDCDLQNALLMLISLTGHDRTTISSLLDTRAEQW